jgi:hypothetical protein
MQAPVALDKRMIAAGNEVGFSSVSHSWADGIRPLSLMGRVI